MRSLIAACILLSSFIFVPLVDSQNEGTFLRDDFNSLDNWKPFFFEKIKEHTEYSIETEGGISYLKAESKASASGLILQKRFKVFEYSKVKWRWKVGNVYSKGNPWEKSGDDYPLRVYIVFEYDPATASYGQKIKYGLLKKLYGYYPAHSSLNYVWAGRKLDERIITNPYASEAKMIVLQAGKENVGKWIEQEVNFVKDYREAFGEDPPETGTLAIMNDSDNTKERSVSYIDFIEVYR